MATADGAYGRTHRALHWIMAALIFGLIGVGLYIPTIPDDPAFNDYKMRVYDLHKWTGIAVLALAVWRLVIRVRRPPAPAEGLADWERTASKAAHWAIYALMIAMPLTGWTSSSALGFPVVWLGVLPLPDLVPRNADLGFALLAVHQTLAWVLIPLLTIHVFAVVWHVAVKKDGVLQRMVSGAR
jgi:cytochrome b561